MRLPCRYNEYQITLSKLEKDKDAKEFGKILQGGIQVASSINKPVADFGVSVIKTASESISLTDRFNDFLNRMDVTRGNVERQKLIKEPLPVLTKAFAASLRAKAEQQPVLLLFDTYEKVIPEIDRWLWHWLLANNELHDMAVRIVITGRNDILKQEGWRKLQQDRVFIYSKGVKRFNSNLTKVYLWQIGVRQEEYFERFYSITKGLPYYLNLIREKLYDGQSVELNLTRLAQNIEDLFFQETDSDKKRLMSQVSRVAACCQSFDRGLIKHLLAQLELPLIVDGKDCYDWLKSQHFFEEGQDRLDDVARDVFRKLLWQEEWEVFSQVHSLLADYFRTKSDRYASPESSYVDKYENDDWLKARSEYLYHRLFADRVDTKEFVGYLLESLYFRENKLVQVPLQGILAESDLDQHPFLSAQGRQFLIKVKPAITNTWAVLEESPIDYKYNKWQWNLSKSEIDAAISTCLDTNEQIGLAKFMLLYCKSKRSRDSEKFDWLMRAKEQVKQFEIRRESTKFICDLLCSKIANSLYELEMYEEVISAYDRVLEINSDDHIALSNKGIALRHLGRYEEAIIAYDQALAIKPDLHQAFYNKGFALRQLGRYEDAITAYDQALATKPDLHQAFFGKGVALGRLGRYDESIAVFDEYLAIKPDDHEAFVNKGIALRQLGNYEEEVAAYVQALAIKPDLHQAFFGKGVALGRLGRYDESIDSYDRALEINPNDPNTWDNRGYALFFAGRYPEAILSYDQALSINPQHANALYNKSCALAVLGEIELAITTLQTSISIEPENRELAKTDPDFDTIRDDARFQQLITELNT
jgi:tetratricopeptide (TPR) repeat protein